jgi:hypothetical protein
MSLKSAAVSEKCKKKKKKKKKKEKWFRPSNETMKVVSCSEVSQRNLP